jgi:large subunit ribosomal protein L23
MSVIKKPLITEKYSAMAEKGNKYGFVVERKATKAQIKKEIELVFNVSVESVNTLIMRGKPKYRNTRKFINNGMTSSFKKAVVTLRVGNKIDFYSNV